ncbi:MAG: hypothetical protein HC800_20910 [Phormidesmis sp. RL_2_1]|nr:hypothetical protein [Phormidesmis sp. RL_2_1]
MEEILNPLPNFPENIAEDLVAESSFGYLLRGTARLAEGKEKEGIADLETAKRLDPSNGHVCMTLGTAYKSNDPVRSLQEYRKAANLFQSAKT